MVQCGVVLGPPYQRHRPAQGVYAAGRKIILRYDARMMSPSASYLDSWLRSREFPQFAAADLAAALGVTPAAVRFWRRGINAPVEQVRARIAELTGAPVDGWMPRAAGRPRK